jgi:hypothetical protein
MSYGVVFGRMSLMSDISEKQKIIDESSRLSPDVSSDLIDKMSVFLDSDEILTELNPSSLKVISEEILDLVLGNKQEHED